MQAIRRFAGLYVLFSFLNVASIVGMVWLLHGLDGWLGVSVPGALFLILLLAPALSIWFGFVRRPKRWL